MQISLWLAALHPRLVSFPIVLILTAIICDALGLLFRNERLEASGKWLMGTGVVTLLFAFICGICAEIWAGRAGVPHDQIEWHEVAATVAAWGFIGVMGWRLFLDGTKRQQMVAYLACAFGIYGMLAVTGFLGGKLVTDYGASVTGANAQTFLTLHGLNTLAQRQTDLNLKYSDLMHHAAGNFVLLLTLSVFVRELWPKHENKVRWVMPVLLCGGGVLLFFFADLDLYRLTDPRQLYDREVQAHKLIATILFAVGLRGLFRKGARNRNSSLNERLQNRMIAVLALVGGGLLFTHVHTVAPYANVAAGVYINHIVMGFVALGVGIVKLIDDLLPRKKKWLTLLFPMLMLVETFLLLTYTEGIPWWAGIGHYNRWGAHGGTIAPYGPLRAELVFDPQSATVDVRVFERFADQPVQVPRMNLNLLVSTGYAETAIPLAAVDATNQHASHFRGQALYLRDAWHFSARLALPVGGRERLGYFDPWVTPVVTGIPPNEVAKYFCPMHEGMRAVTNQPCAICGMEMIEISTNRKPPLHDERYAMELSHGERAAHADRSVPLVFSPMVKDTGNVLQNLQVVHEHLLHLIIVNEDLTYFDHVHPALGSGGQFFQNYRFPKGGDYLLFADITPQGERSQVFRLPLFVEGESPEEGFGSLTVSPALAREIGPYHVKIVLQPRQLLAERESELAFQIFQDGRPVTDLEPYIGAMGHCVIIHEDTLAFLHAHPVLLRKSVGVEERGGPEVRFHTTFPKPGRYKVWGQFKRGGKILIADFVVDVQKPLFSPGVVALIVGE